MLAAMRLLSVITIAASKLHVFSRRKIAADIK